MRFEPRDTSVRIYEETSHRFVQLFPLECHIAQLMDGRRTVDDLVSIARQFNQDIARDQVEMLVISLDAVGLLTPDEGERPQNLPAGVLVWQTGNAPMGRSPLFWADDDDDDLGGSTEIASTNPDDDVLDRETDQRFAELMLVAPPDLDSQELPIARQHFEVVPQTTRGLAVAPVAAVAAAVEAVEYEPIPDDIVIPPPPPLPTNVAFPAPPPIPDDIVIPPPPPPPSAPASPSEAMTAEMLAAQEQEHLLETQRLRWYQRRSLRVLAVLGILIGIAAVVPWPLRITSDCTIIPSERVRVRTELAGVLVKILVGEGQFVKKGDVIARLDDRTLRSDRLKALAEIEKLEAQLVTLKSGHRPEEIQQQAAVLAARRTEAAFAAKQAARKNQMVREGVGSKAAAEDANRDVQTKIRAVAEAQAALRLVKAGARPEEIASHEAVIKRAKVELAYIDQRLAATEIRAPIDGEILTPRFRERVNEAVETGGLVCEIANMKRMRAEIHVEQRFVDAITVGMPAIVKVESYPDHPFEGKVDFIAPAADDESRRIRVVVELDNAGGLLKANMTGYGEVEAGERSVLRLVTRRITRWIRVRFLL